MYNLPRAVSPVVALNVVGIGLSALATIAGLRVATSEGTATSDNTASSDDTARTLDPALTTETPARTEHAPSAETTASAPSAGVASVRINAGQLSFAPNDWESVDKIRRTDAHVPSFWLDRYEVTYADWARCASCSPLSTISTNPLHPVVDVTPERARAFCQHRGGRLPTRHEWVFAASTPDNNRYPWGQTGLVCRKVVFGMVKGPCAFSQFAQAVGARPEGATTTGVQDLSGNVAEWATEGERYLAVGGSFRSTLAGQLKVWSAEDTQLPRDDIGFRCAYDAAANDIHE